MTGSETSENIVNLANKATEWTSSDEGKDEIKKAFERAAKTSERYEADQLVDLKNLSKPVTI